MRGFKVWPVVTCMWASAVYAGEDSRVPVGAEVEALKGAVAFCQELPSRCQPHPEARMKLDAGRMAELVFVNLWINIEVRFQEEPMDVDVWQDRDFITGDCEDYALRKRRELIRLGWPPGALRLVIVRRQKDDREMHVVLVASTDQKDLVLDVPGESMGQFRAWDSKEFYQLKMIWGADAKWYSLTRDPPIVTAVGTGN